MEDKRQQQLDDLRRAFESGVLPEDTYRALVTQLDGDPEQAMTAKTGDSGIIQQGQDNVLVTDHSLYVGGDFRGNVYMGTTPDDDTAKLRIYRQWLLRAYGRLPMRGVDIKASDPTSEQKAVALSHVYVDLDTTNLVHHLLPAGSTEEEREPEPIPVLQKVIENRRVVLLGDPGGGKTTFVNHLAYELARQGLQPKRDLAEILPDWPAPEADVLPVLVILRDFAQTIPEKPSKTAVVHDLWSFITQQLKDQNLEFMVKLLQEKLETGQVMLLFDGLDEVGTVPQRLFVRDVVHAFCNRYPHCRCLITCRILAYQPPSRANEPDMRLHQETFPSFEIAKFDDAKINRFIAAWYVELTEVGTVNEKEAPRLTQQLQASVQQPDLHRLAVNPLLLTVMALVHTHRGRLPTARALLYEETVDMLLWRWEQIKTGRQEDVPQLQQLLREAERQDMDLKRMLWQLAYEAHSQSYAQSVKAETANDKPADITDRELREAIALLKQDEYGQPDYNWTEKVIATIQQRAGLLVERLPGVFSFPHRTFQEYLAGAYLSTQASFATEAARKGWGRQFWREVILLAVGRLIHVSGDTDKPLALVAELCPEIAEDDPEAWRLAWLAGDVLLEIDEMWIKKSAFGRDLQRRVRLRLADLVGGGHLTPRERAEAGKTLAQLGDPRPGVGIVQIGDRKLPDIEFCYVPPGPFLMGEDGERDEEQPQHEVDIPYGYWIAKYPVTTIQFRTFLQSTNYEIQGRFEQRERDPHNFPARLVTWDDALRFCTWLTEILQQGGSDLPALPKGYQVTLPSEAEWEKAARGGILLTKEKSPIARLGDAAAKFVQTLEASAANPRAERRYPWGNQFELDHANSRESQIGEVCAVGMFPNGRSPYSLLDMSGNVWEWTRSLYQPYFYEADDGREDLSSKEFRTLRGGGINSNEDRVRCGARLNVNPDFVDGSFGFRLVVSPFSDSD